MRNFLHSVSSTYTSHADVAKGLGRGLLRDAKGNPVLPENLAEFVASEPSLVIRQTIGVLDKIISKKRFLRLMSYEAYVHRAKLAEQIWQELLRKFDALGVEFDKAAKKKLQERWIAKAHPYQMHDVKGLNPEADDNGQFLAELEMSNTPEPFESFQGKWFSTFWGKGGNPTDHAKIARSVIHHLFDQELIIKNAPRESGDKSNRKATGMGLMHARGTSAAGSVSDPRKASRKLQNENKWDAEAAQIYFRNGDSAAEIFDSLSRMEGRNDRINTKWFGERLHAHFKKVNFTEDEFSKGQKQRLWNFNNATRTFYKKLAQSERFRLAVRKAKDGDEKEQAKLLTIVPRDKDGLIRKLAHATLSVGEVMPLEDRNAFSYVKGNAEISRAIRLGKIVVHAADAITDDSRADKADFARVLEELVTSDGQTEIKRLETSARIWRRSTALSLRTLKALVDPDGKTVVDGNEDLTSVDVAIRAYKSLAEDTVKEHLDTHMGIIFGKKEIGSGDDAKSRASILSIGSANDRKEAIWALMRIAAQVRHATFHFNVRRRLLAKIRNGLVTVAKKQPKDLSAENWVISERADKAFKDLLKFDQDLRGQAVKTELEQLKAEKYVAQDQLNAIVTEISRQPGFDADTLPRFMNVARKAQNLAKTSGDKTSIEKLPLKNIVLGNEEGADDLANLCKVGLLRLLYNSGFRDWLVTTLKDEGRFRSAVEAVIMSKNERTDEYHREDGKTVPTVSDMAEHLGLENFSTLEELLSGLTAQSMRASGQDKKYSADKKQQQNQSNEIEAFRQEFFAHLFAEYLGDPAGDAADPNEKKKTSLNWIASISTKIDASPGALDAAMAAFEPPQKDFQDHWQHRFYAWLYLIPPEEASMLRQQIRKSIILEEKAETISFKPEGAERSLDTKTMDMLAEMDWLIGLYTKVQSVGFQGTEHEGALEQSNVLYEDRKKFDAIYSTEETTHSFSIAGTRRGLRQLVRFAHLKALTPIFSKHLVSDKEVEAFTEMDSAKNKDLFDEFYKLRADIRKAESSRTPKEDKDVIDAKPYNIARYKEKAVEVCAHNFDVNAARLSDHVRLHRMMMQIFGRLSDYTLMWERDRLYALIGFLYIQDPEASFELKTESDNSLILLLKPSLSSTSRRISLYTEKNGFNSASFKDEFDKFEGGQGKVLKKYFSNLEEQNPHDADAQSLAIKEKKSFRKFPPAGKPERKNKAHIRNDLVHQNVLDSKDKPAVQLTYTINAVRSLMAYDKKLKNAVPKSIKRILGDYGLSIEWKMSTSDRLTKPNVTPAKETHLGFCRQKKDQEPIRFDLPRASPRFTSMAQALFDFGTSGHTEEMGKSDDYYVSRIRYATTALHGYDGDPNAVKKATIREFRFRKIVKS
ncbi:type VI-A CRISPR-associated RNA-guided ribonuclease Cas13a [Roseovarius sp. MS2]|uniref:type VI-A CRISPR-associated RNA-guided ribonuclease Cas13a n=1 Tax=Roseovarius sp. MS2 TaxID=3390728 RepID=UPI003EDC24E2